MTEHVMIRWMIRADYPAVLEVEHGSFEYPWSLADLVRHLQRRNCVGLVAEHEEQVVGFVIYDLHKDRIHVQNFAVAPAYRRRGIGRRMIDRLVGKLSRQHRKLIVMETRERNLCAQLFFRAQRFRWTDTILDHYDNGETAYRFGLPFGAARGPCNLKQTESATN